MGLVTLTLTGQRRRAAELAAAATARARDGERRRRRLAAALRSRIATPESLALGVVAGMAFGTLAPGLVRYQQSPAERSPLARHPLLREALRIARTYAISRLAVLMSGAGPP